MRIKNARIWLWLLVLNDACVIYFSFWIAYQVRFHFDPFTEHFPVLKGTPPWRLYQEALRAVVPLWLLIFSLWGRLYQRRLTDPADEFMAIAKSIVLGTLLIIAGTFLYRRYEYSRLVMALSFGISLFLLFSSRAFWRALAEFLYERVLPQETVVVLGEGKGTRVLAKIIEREPHTDCRLYSVEDLPKARAALEEGRPLREIFVAGQLLGRPEVLEWLDDCEEHEIEIKILPDFLEMRMGEVIVDDSLKVPILHLKPLSLHGFRRFVKRFFDVSISILAVSVFFIPLAIMAFLIRMDSRGGVFFSQERVGFKGKHFRCLKFRTMHRNAEKLLKEMNLESFRGGPAFKMKGDPRVTRVGKWVRKLSLDEAAQIWNVLRGEMSLIGPRPQVLAEAGGNPDWAWKRYRVLPGITGLWQVSGRADLPYEEMMRLDIFYLENWSPGLDLKILLKTLPVVLGAKGAY